jgi:hypothetical protein
MGGHRSSIVREGHAERQREMDGKGDGDDDDDRGGREALGNVPFEFVGEVASAGAVAEARDVEGGTAAARHGAVRWGMSC